MTWYLFSVQHFHLASSVSGWQLQTSYSRNSPHLVALPILPAWLLANQCFIKLVRMTSPYRIQEHYPTVLSRVPGKEILCSWLFVFEMGSCHAGLELLNLLPSPPKCWDYRHEPLSLISFSPSCYRFLRFKTGPPYPTQTAPHLKTLPRPSLQWDEKRATMSQICKSRGQRKNEGSEKDLWQ